MSWLRWIFGTVDAEIAAENAKLREELERARKEMTRIRDDYNKWEAEFQISKERDQLREALNLAERDNYRLHGIIAALRQEIHEGREKCMT